MEKINEYNFFELIEYKSLKEIEDYLEKLNNIYHKDPKNAISDNLYDMFIEYTSRKYPESKILKKIGENKLKNFKKLPVYLGSEDKTYEHDNGLTRWKNKNKIEDDSEVLISSKADGICILIYDNFIYTRGNGLFGRDITHIQKYLNFNIKDLRVRGELIINKDDFNKINESDNFKTIRNLVCGQLNKKNIDKEIAKYFRFLGYDVIDSNLNQEQKFKKFQELEIDTVKYKKINGKDLNYENLKETLIKWKNELNYDIDGLVIRDNKNHKLTENKNYSWSISYKNNFNIYEAHVKEVQWNISKFGKYIPKAVLSPPVNINNTMIQFVTCHNAEYVINNSIGKGSIINIMKSGDIIPYIHSIIKKGEVILPENAIRKGVHLYSADSKIQKLKYIIDFLKYFKYDNIRLKKLEKIDEEIEINNMLDFLNLKDKDLKFVGEKTSEEIYNIIDDILSKEIHIVDFLVSMSVIENVGYKRLSLVFEKFPNILDDEYTMYDKLVSIKGIKDKIASEIVKGAKRFRKNKNRFEKYFKIKYDVKDKSNNLKTIKVCLSGFRDITSIQDNIKLEVVENIKDCDYLIVKDLTKTTKKITEAKNKGKQILNLNDFINQFKH